MTLSVQQVESVQGVNGSSQWKECISDKDGWLVDKLVISLHRGVGDESFWLPSNSPQGCGLFSYLVGRCSSVPRWKVSGG